jgi:hypothetical protein
MMLISDGQQPPGDAAEQDQEAEHEERHRVADQVVPAGVQERGRDDPGRPSTSWAWMP